MNSISESVHLREKGEAQLARLTIKGSEPEFLFIAPTKVSCVVKINIALVRRFCDGRGLNNLYKCCTNTLTKKLHMQSEWC